MIIKQLGLIGYPLSHSFSKRYFTEKFEQLGLSHSHQYNLYEMAEITALPEIIKKTDHLIGLNVTIPHKRNVFRYLDELDSSAEKIGAVNVIKILEGKRLKGYNSDYYGFKRSLEEFLPKSESINALILGTGGASQAVKVALEDLGISYLQVSRTKTENTITYEDANVLIPDFRLIINCTPLGTYPNVYDCPNLHYNLLTNRHYLYDLVYNPEETLFMFKGKSQNAKTLNGYMMLVYQAEKSWEIWNQ